MQILDAKRDRQIAEMSRSKMSRRLNMNSLTYMRPKIHADGIQKWRSPDAKD